MKIAFFEIEDWEKEYIKSKLKNHKLFFSKENLSEDNINKIKDCEVISIFIYSRITKEILDKIINLKLICTMSTGFDHIDLEECKKRKITVCNVPYYGENTVAEHAFALILALTRKIIESVDRTRKDNFSVEGLMGFDLKGKTLGIIGLGHIGKHVARIAKGFGMNILVNSRKKEKKLEKQMSFKYVSLNELLRNSDIITLHCLLCKETNHLINMKNIKLIKKGAYLINTARGNLIDTKALLYALDNKILAGAGLDVLEDENLIKEERQLLKKQFLKGADFKILLGNHQLLKKRNVIITPHNAFHTKEALIRILDTTLGSIDSFNNKNKINIVR